MNYYKLNTNEAFQIRKMIYEKFNNSDIVYMIQKYYIMLSNDLNGFLFDAIINNNLELVRVLIESYKLDINTKTESDSTPLMFASQQGNLEIVKYLCDMGAKTSYKNKYGNDIYFYGNKEIIQYLCNRKKLYILILVEGSYIDTHYIIETSKEKVGIYIKNNVAKLLKFFITILQCNTISSKINKYTDQYDLLAYDDEFKIKLTQFQFYK